MTQYQFCLGTGLLALISLFLEFIYIKFFDDSDNSSRMYIYMAMISCIPLVNAFIASAFFVYICYLVIKQICGPGFDYLDFKLDTYRNRNNDIKIHKRLSIENELSLLKKSLITAGIFKSKYEINDFLDGLKVFEKLGD